MSGKAWVPCTVVVCVASLVGVSCRASPKGTAPKTAPSPVVRTYAIVDVAAPPEWKAAHQARLVWDGNEYPLPVVFRFPVDSDGETVSASGRALSGRESDISLEVAGRPAVLKATSQNSFDRVPQTGSVLFDVPGGNCLAIATYVSVAPAGVDANGVRPWDVSRVKATVLAADTIMVDVPPRK